MIKKIKHPVPEKHLIEIGNIIVSFALLENSLQSFIGKMISGKQRVGNIITSELSFKNLRAISINLYIDIYGKSTNYEELKRLISEAGNLEVKRNKIVHSVWGAGKNSDYITRIKKTAKERKGLYFQFEEMSNQDLKKIADDIKICIYNISTFKFSNIKTN